MKRLVTASLALLALTFLASASPAWGQYLPGYNPNPRGLGPSQYNRPGPPLSPYLNLLRGGNPAANYYLGVVPEIERRQNDAQFRAAITELDRRTEPLTEAESLERTLQPTGHAVQFLNYGSYYLSTGTRPTAASAPSTSPPTRRR